MATLGGCATAKQKKVQKHLRDQLAQNLFNNHFTGFLVIDQNTKDTLFSHNGHRYFTPASNTKIFTLFASLKMLPDEVPTLQYVAQNDTIFVEGTGDPSLLHPYFGDSTSINLMKQYSHVALHLNNFVDTRFAPGWAWEDYQWYFSPEKSVLPLYGNVVTVFQGDSLNVSPPFFADNVVPLDYPVQREEYKNTFYFNTTRKDTVAIPFLIDSTLVRSLLENVLQKKVSLINEMPQAEKKVVYGISRDSICRMMMLESDNFLAEQLLVMASSTLSDTLNTNRAKQFVVDTLLADLRQPPRWVDGSGLSRYNLFTPESMVHVLHRMYNEIPQARLFELFPAGGVSGTLEDWYAGTTEPYIYAKTGSLGNNHNLSGYLITKSGKTLTFSFMNNHFRVASSEVKKRMQETFEFIRDTY
ncbi:D-alanyl-D-alanine carboxypeptidase/D-alanyl-D-alanine-endopeptidase [Allomuricauda sp. SCSIO 65647]|uniref:D-alanyl-D-alanine carboxypeptidase/D-alanyl-D-alanine-endopeptidase n=1 Tax=Allomuricauda sp. SCSIO 65647 TaxID=2908843 RepID=UPI001F36A7B4|nr:D-alanyl-D-alanine carboxypeptidase [Muricauda sp. SCSIO 65647]UJH67780.1 D-alanyl-D-alanine carboxypeptidase [Muricauda sp. SCSIO 65647]